jgi:signal transduction histidine kinase
VSEEVCLPQTEEADADAANVWQQSMTIVNRLHGGKAMENGHLHVLLVGNDDDVASARNALALVDQPKYEIDHASCIDDAAGLMHDDSYDAVLFGLGLDESTGVKTLEHFRTLCGESMPVVVLSERADEETALRVLDEGAQDYIVKDTINPESLSRSMRCAMQRQKQLKTTSELLQQKNAHLAQLYSTAQQFVDNVSHEFRTPLTVIREFASIIRDGLDGPVTPQQADHLGKVLHRTDDLALMVDDMLDVSRLEAGLLGIWRRPCCVAKLIEDVYGLLQPRAASKRVALSIHVQPNLPKVFCDEEKVQRVIVNLTVNAIKFTPERGQILIWAKQADDPGEVVIGVADSGPGICPDDLEVVFQRFRQLNGNVHSSTKGYGLGLSIASELVRLNLGTMHVESTPGKGSMFSFTLPRDDTTVVIERHVARLAAAAEATSHASLIISSIDNGHVSSLETAILIDEFLQRSVRATDLVMRGAGQSWVIAAACGKDNIDELVARLTNDWGSYARNCPGLTLPAMHFTVCGTWRVPQQMAIFKSELQRLVGASSTTSGVVRTVLVVDNDHEVSSCLSVRLRAAGFEVISAYDGEEGLALALDHHPDAVVLDIFMPKKDGLEVLRELRANESTASIPIVMLSVDIYDQHLALEAGADFFVAKPYEAKSVLDAIESSICKRGAHEHEFHPVDRR